MKGKLLVGVGIAAVAAIAVGTTALSMAASPATNVANTSSDSSYHNVTRQVMLQGMPQGTAVFGRDGNQDLTVHITVSGLTPGSTHTVRLARPGLTPPATNYFNFLVANAQGDADATVTASTSFLDANGFGTVSTGTRLQILEGKSGSFGNNQGSALDRLVIAQSAPLPHNPASATRSFQSRLQPTSFNFYQTSQGVLTGSAQFVYQPNVNGGTLSVWVNASGLTPGAHAAHIHNGSCASQGDVLVMLPDLTANSGGVISTTVTVNNVGAKLRQFTPGTMYLNIHQGDMNQIVMNGTPSLSFRPMLCGNV